MKRYLSSALDYCHTSQYKMTTRTSWSRFVELTINFLPKGIPFFFGKSVNLKCLKGIETFEIPTSQGTQEVCYAAKVVKESIFLPWKVYVDNYVFAVDRPVSGYFKTDESTINSLQTIDVDIDKKSSYSNGSASAIYRYISGILSF